jgi:prepilin-type N-terminal cleavage/methylation domain-containing protein
MSKIMRIKKSGNSGFTLAEVLVAMAISAIVFTGMLVAYTEGIGYTREDSSLMNLYAEGSAAMSKMGRYIREAGRIRVSPYGGASNARIRLEYPREGFRGGDIEFIYSQSTHKIRWNYSRGGANQLNMILLPMLNTHTGPNEVPYLRVRDCRFTPLDHIGTPSPYLEGYFMIKIEMVLEDARGDTLYLSSVHTKRNEMF